MEEEKLKLNLGCGTDIRKGYVNVDKISRPGVDKVWNLNQYPYPFEDNSVEEIIAFHILEHVREYEKTIDELRRILKQDGILHIKVPHFAATAAYSEFHRRFFWWNSFTSERFSGGTTSLESQEYNSFQTISKRLNFEKKPAFWNYLIEPLMNIGIMPQIYENTILKAIFPCLEIELKLKMI